MSEAYFRQGTFPLREAVSAIVVTEKDKPVRVYGHRGPTALSWGLWEVPEADNDEEFDPPPMAA